MKSRAALRCPAVSAGPLPPCNVSKLHAVCMIEIASCPGKSRFQNTSGRPASPCRSPFSAARSFSKAVIGPFLCQPLDVKLCKGTYLESRSRRLLVAPLRLPRRRSRERRCIKGGLGVRTRAVNCNCRRSGASSNGSSVRRGAYSGKQPERASCLKGELI